MRILLETYANRHRSIRHSKNGVYLEHKFNLKNGVYVNTCSGPFTRICARKCSISARRDLSIKQIKSTVQSRGPEHFSNSRYKLHKTHYSLICVIFICAFGFVNSNDAVFRTYTLLYHIFGNIAIYRNFSVRKLIALETKIIRQLVATIHF